jgi:hypothetical protein
MASDRPLGQTAGGECRITGRLVGRRPTDKREPDDAQCVSHECTPNQPHGHRPSHPLWEQRPRSKVRPSQQELQISFRTSQFVPLGYLTQIRALAPICMDVPNAGPFCIKKPPAK